MKHNFYIKQLIICIMVILPVFLPSFSYAQFTPLMDESLVNTTTAGDQENYYWSVRTVAVQPDGGFVKVWIDKNALDGQADGIFAQRYSNKGTKLGSQFQVNTLGAGVQSSPCIAVAPNGSFAIAWEGPGTSTDVYAQRFTKDGVRIGNEFLLNTTVKGGQTSPEIQFFSDGSFVAGFVDGSQTVMQRFSADGRPVGLETRISSQTTGNVIIDGLCVRSDNSVLLTWTDNGDVYGQIFTSTLQPVGTATRLNTYLTNTQQYAIPRIDANDNVVVVWESSGQDGSGLGVYGRRFDKNLNPLGAEFAITSNTTGDQIEPQVTMEPGGRFLIAWTDKNNRDGGGSKSESVWFREYAANGTPVGSETLVNKTVSGAQAYPTMDINPSGRLVISWEGNGNQAGQIDSYGVFARSYQLSQSGTTVINVSTANASVSDVVTVTMTVTHPTSISGVSPNSLKVDGTKGIFAVLVKGPTPASATVGTTPVTFTWTYQLTGMWEEGTITFGGNAKTADGIIFPYANSSSISVKSSLSISDLTGPSLIGDANNPGVGPKVFTIGAKLVNTSVHELTDVNLYLGNGISAGSFPETTMLLSQTNNTYEGSFALTPIAGKQDCSRALGSLKPAKRVIEGAVDFNGDGIISALDKGTLSNGKKVINGLIDVNLDASITAADDLSYPPGVFSGYREPAIIDGYVDVNRDKVIDALDHGTYGGENRNVYWQVLYSVTDQAGKSTFGDCNDIGDDLRYDWVIWGTALENGVQRNDSVRDYAKVRCMQSAASNKIAPSGGYFTSASRRVIAGQLDINGDGVISTADDGSFAGKTFIDGKADMDKNGVINTADDGIIIGFPVIDGLIDANISGSVTTADDGIIVAPNETFSVTINNVTFGTVGSGYDENRDGLWDLDFWYQPVGDIGWPSQNFRLVDIQADITGSGGANPLNGITVRYDNEPYLSRLIDDRLNEGGSFNGSYTFTFQVISPSNAYLMPYQMAASGTNNVKYNSDYSKGLTVFVGNLSTLPAHGFKATATLQQQKASINWTTETEVNSSYFDVERSTDGKTFTKIYTAVAAGNSTARKQYFYEDDISTLAKPSNIYYRIRLTGNEQQSSVSNIVKLTPAVKPTVNVWPNPFLDRAQVTVTATDESKWQIALVDVSGRVVESHEQLLSKGTHALVLANLAKLSGGVYFVRIKNGEYVENIKLLKTR